VPSFAGPAQSPTSARRRPLTPNYLQERRKKSIAAGEQPDPASLSDEALLLTEIRDLLRQQRAV
jgi:hypothetical protein